MTESLDESLKLNKGFIFWVRNFYGFIFWVQFYQVFMFLGITKNVLAKPPYHIHLGVHSIGQKLLQLYLVL